MLNSKNVCLLNGTYLYYVLIRNLQKIKKKEYVMKLNKLVSQLFYLHTHMSMGSMDKFLIMGINHDSDLRYIPLDGRKIYKLNLK